MTEVESPVAARWGKLHELAPTVCESFVPLRKQVEDDPLTRITLIGPYDSGKSSLLKRLLVEAGCPVPDWLTVSARRETFQANSAELWNLRFQDTPGIGGGVQVHSDAAHRAALVSDVLVLVLPPQLITGELSE